MGGYNPKAIAGEHRAWLLQRTKERDFTLSGLVPELAERGLKVDYRSVCNFVHVEKLRFKKASSPANATVPTLPASGRSGQSIKIGLSLSA
jgi:transposase